MIDYEQNIEAKRGFLGKIRTWFITGLIVLAPAAVSVWLLVQAFRLFDSILGKWYTLLFFHLGWDKAYIPGLGAITLAILVCLVGLIAHKTATAKFINLWDKMVNRVPLMSRIYVAVRQLSDSFVEGRGIIFKRPVFVEYPRKGIFSIGFVTRDCEGPFCELAGTQVSSVFIPTTPNPTSGVIIFVPQNELREIGMGVEDAMKLVISAGTLTPDIKLPVMKGHEKALEDGGISPRETITPGTVQAADVKEIDEPENNAGGRLKDNENV